MCNKSPMKTKTKILQILNRQVDFVCYERKLVIEVDGGGHAQRQEDRVRDQWLKRQGFEILRFWDHDVLRNRDGVLQKIIDRLNPPPAPSPPGGRERLLSKVL